MPTSINEFIRRGEITAVVERLEAVRNWHRDAIAVHTDAIDCLEAAIKEILTMSAEETGR